MCVYAVIDVKEDLFTGAKCVRLSYSVSLSSIRLGGSIKCRWIHTFKALAMEPDCMQESNPTELAQIVMYNPYGYARSTMCVNPYFSCR